MSIHRVLTSLMLCAALGAQAPKLVDKAPQDISFHGKTLGGQTIDRSQFHDNVLIVDLWGTWCPPCRAAVPVLVDLYQKYKQHGLEIVGFCYDKDGAAEDADKVRKFAVENKVTYHLVPGDEAVRKQVPDFTGYPTLLVFGRGGAHVKTKVGFDDDTGAELEALVRGALGLDLATTEAADGPDGESAAEAKIEVPAGRLFEPGNGDHGLLLHPEDIHGDAFDLANLAGAPVLLALTSSWDQEAVRTSTFLEAARKELTGLHVFAWHLERDSDPKKKVAAMRAFLAGHGAGYAAFTTQLKLASEKVHRFAAMPTLLLFDGKGVLVSRENGISDEIERRLRAKAQALFGTGSGR